MNSLVFFHFTSMGFPVLITRAFNRKIFINRLIEQDVDLLII